jgi:hypothetical protein
MLKIWLTWLQPSLGIVGVLLVLASPLYSLAVEKPSTVNRASKAAKVVTGSVKAPTGVELAGITATPDLAVRQLAVGALEPTNIKANAVAAKAKQQSNRDALDAFLTPSTPKVAKNKATEPKLAKSPLNTALARTTPARATVPVTGIFIGNSEVRGASKYNPSISRSVQPIASTEIGAPTPLSAMIGAPKKVSPYPVVSPETMQQLGNNPATVAKTPARALSPIAKSPAVTKQATPAVKPVAAVTVPSSASVTTQSLKPTVTKLDRVVPQSLDPIATIPAPFRQEVPNSLDPIASIPSGLQRLLGNNLNDTQPAVAPVRVAKALAPKVNPLKASPILAINNLVAPTASTAVAPSGASLQLATAQAYVNVPKFDIPGERLAAATLAKPTTASIVAKPAKKATFVAKVQPKKDDYLPIVAARQFESHTKQSWTLVGERNNLGGLILGSQPQTTLSNKIGLLPSSALTTAGSRGLSGIERRVIN